MKLIEALQSLDVENNAHWTANGLPSVAAVREIMEDQSVTRDEIRLTAPTLDRTSAAKEKESPVSQDTPDLAPAADTPENENKEPEAGTDSPTDPEPPAPALDPEPPAPMLDPAPVAESKTPLQEKEEKSNALRQEMDDIKSEMNTIKNDVAQKTAMLNDLQQKLDVVQRKMDSEIGPEDDFRMANLAYLETQKKNLAANAERMRQFKEMETMMQDSRYPVDKQYDMGRYGRLHGPIHAPKS